MSSSTTSDSPATRGIAARARARGQALARSAPPRAVRHRRRARCAGLDAFADRSRPGTRLAVAPSIIRAREQHMENRAIETTDLEQIPDLALSSVTGGISF